MTEPASLVAERLTKRYRSGAALDGASFELTTGLTALAGRNGSGKTTLLAALAGLLPLDGGRVRWNGQDLDWRSRRERIFYVPDGIVPYRRLAAGRVLAALAAAFSRTAADVDRLISRLQLSEASRTRVGDLSKGTRKRLVLAIGCLSRQPLLLLDEPFDGLDFLQAREATALLHDVVTEGRSVFAAIHSLPEAERSCERFVVLDRGRVVGEGTMNELRKRAGSETASLEEVVLAILEQRTGTPR